jgi:2-polyprenyl-6-methoxyphenol hydroxylase-like FAD-dependent oxidoreductase
LQTYRILIIGAGIGGMTAAIALGKRGFRVDMIEKDPAWTVYGVGIIQQSNVVRAMHALGLLEDYLDAGFGFDFVDIFSPAGDHLATVPSHKLVEGYPANVGISRRALQRVLGDRAREHGAAIHLGVTAAQIENTADTVTVTLSDGRRESYDVVIGADGLNSTTRKQIFPAAPGPKFTGQGVWRYNFPRPEDIVSLHAYAGPIGMGFVPMSASLMYLYITTPEPGNPHYDRAGLAAAMRGKLGRSPPAVAACAGGITDNDAVVYRPMEWIFLEGDWHKGRVVLLGDAVHATTPHLGQGAGMAIEDAIVLAEELAQAAAPQTAFSRYQLRRRDRCRYIVDKSREIGESQLGLRPPVDQAAATSAMFKVVAAPI